MASSNSLTQEQPVRHVPSDLIPEWLKQERTRILTDPNVTVNFKAALQKDKASCSVVYWMMRDVRAVDNWALSFAMHTANLCQLPLHVVYALPPPPAKGDDHDEDDEDDDLPPTLMEMPLTERHGFFLLGGLELVHQELNQQNIPMHVVMPKSYAKVGKKTCQHIVEQCKAVAVITDFSPLRHYREWTELQAVPYFNELKIPFVQVDAHNVVPVWMASPKREVGARTLRPKIHKVIQDYLQSSYPSDLTVQVAAELKKTKELTFPSFDRPIYEQYLKMDKSVPAIAGLKPGTQAGMAQFEFFVQHGLKRFDDARNDPNEKHVCSNLSPYLNYGHVSFQRITEIVQKQYQNKYANGTKAFIEEGVIRRELSDNYCYYTPDDYDSLNAAADWARESLELHTQDPREYTYTLKEWEQGQTHDDLWNAAQLQLTREGGMHGFLRMYWAKKVLEWSDTPERALRTAQYLNDKYALDGRDPNGFVGVSWSIFGLHDMGWKEREVFGKIRYMNYAGCKRKFKVADFVRKYKGAAENAQRAEERHRKSKFKATGAASGGQKRKAASSSTEPKQPPPQDKKRKATKK